MHHDTYFSKNILYQKISTLSIEISVERFAPSKFCSECHRLCTKTSKKSSNVIFFGSDSLSTFGHSEKAFWPDFRHSRHLIGAHWWPLDLWSQGEAPFNLFMVLENVDFLSKTVNKIDLMMTSLSSCQLENPFELRIGHRLRSQKSILAIFVFFS